MSNLSVPGSNPEAKSIGLAGFVKNSFFKPIYYPCYLKNKLEKIEKLSKTVMVDSQLINFFPVAQIKFVNKGIFASRLISASSVISALTSLAFIGISIAKYVFLKSLPSLLPHFELISLVLYGALALAAFLLIVGTFVQYSNLKTAQNNVEVPSKIVD